MAERELPPIRVRIMGDSTHFDDTLKSILKALTQLNTEVKAREVFQQKSQQSAEIHQQKLQQSAITHAQELRNLQQKYRQSEVEHLRKVHAAQQKSQESATMHQQKLHNAQQVQQRAADAAQQRSQQSAAAYQQRSQESATMHQQRLYNAQQVQQRAADAAQQRSQQSAEMHQQRLYNAQQVNQRAADAAQQRSQQSAEIHQQRLYNTQQVQQRAADAAQQRSQQSAAIHQQRSQESATMHQQRLHNAQQVQQRAADAAQQRSQQSADMHQQRLYNSQQANQRAADAAQQRSQHSAALHQQRLHNAQQVNQRAADAAQQRSQQSAALHQQRMHNSQQSNQRAADAAQQRSQQSAATHQNTIANQNKLNAQKILNLQNKGLADIQWITNKINNDNALAAAKQLTEAQRLSNLQTSANIAMAKGRVQVNNLMQQTLVIQQRLNNLQDDNHRKAIKHNEQMKKSAQVLADMQRKANQDTQMHALKMQALQQKMQIEREIHAKRMASRYYTTHPTKFSYTAPTRTFGSGGSGSGLGGGLTSRADIYMHTNAIRNTIELARGLVNLRIQYRENEVAIEAFAGSSEKAAAAMKAIQQFAEVSPYSTLELAQAARNMMSFGVSTDETIKVMRHLGEVAGGSQFRLERLAFAMSQIVSTGKLVGNDLRQLTEQGFNPLQTIADKTKISIETLNKAKENGLITSEDVINALKMETTGTGRFAGVLRKVSAEMGGLMNQAKEGMRNTAMEFIKILEPSINQSLKRLLMFIESFRQFMKDNPQRVVQIANLAKNIFMLKVGFHLLGLSVASVRWSATSLLATFKGLRLLALPITASMAMLSLILGSIASTVTAIASGSILGVVASLAGMVKALAGLAAVGMGIALLRDYIAGKGGLKEAFRAMVIDISILNERMKGFFTNIKENLGILDTWFRTNFDAIIGVVSSVANSMLSALIDNMMLVGKSLIEAFSIAFNWLLANLPMIIGKFKEAWKKSDTAAAMFKRRDVFIASQLAGILDALATGQSPFLPNFLRRSGSPFKDMLADVISKNPKLIGGGNGADAANKAFSDGMLGVGQKLLAGLKSGFEKIDLKGLALPNLNLKAAEKPVKEPALPDWLEAFDADFKELMERIMKMMEEPEKKLKTGSAYSVAEAMNFNSAQFAVASYEALMRLRDFQAGQKAEKNPMVREQAETNRKLEKLIELQRKSGPKLEAIGAVK